MSIKRPLLRLESVLPSSPSHVVLNTNGRFNGILGLGDQLWFFRGDQIVRSIVLVLGFDVDAIRRSALHINRARNDAAHRDASHTTVISVRSVRDTLRESLKTLSPQHKQNVDPSAP